MKRRGFLVLVGSAAMWPLGSRAQTAGKAYRIGVLEIASAALNGPDMQAFREGMREHGHAEGETYSLEFRAADGHDARFPKLAEELTRLNVDVILTRGTRAALAAKAATTTIPIVMAGLGDPVSSGIIASLARPGGNITGLTAIGTELQAKRLELLLELLPRVKRIAAIFNLSNPVGPDQWRETESAARSFGLHIQLFDVRKSDDLAPAFEAASTQRAEAMVVALDGVTLTNRRTIVDLAAKHRMPAVYAAREFVDAGGLMAYGVFPHLYHRAAYYVVRIFKGAKPADLPVERPTRFDLAIDLKTAEALGLTIPRAMQARADELIK